jgi:cytochrome c556
MRLHLMTAAATVALATSAFVSLPAAAQQNGDTVKFEDVQKEISETFDVIGKYGEQQRQEAVDAFKASLERIDARIDQLEQRVRQNWSSMSEAARDRTAGALRELRVRRNRLSEAYGALQQGAGDAWSELQQGASRSWSELEKAWDEAEDAASASQTEPDSKKDDKG